MNLEDLLATRPLFHVHENQPHSWQLSTDVLKFIDAEVLPGLRTIETGEGYSTVLFALKRCHHTCVTINAPGVERIREFCAEHAISLDTVTFDTRPSQVALPGREMGTLDVVLIDGGHGFPTPMVDWFYMVPALRVGGIVVVDDTQIWTGKVLRDFMAADSAWGLVFEHPGRTAVFRKLAIVDVAAEFYAQPYVMQHTRQNDRWRRRARVTGQLIRAGHWDALAGKAIGYGARAVRRLVG
ncbi:MAG TPA: class I SAM-dependent methyltransferase [Candidatus Dormibacteraeota bacterium]|jgi:hypothetical protein